MAASASSMPVCSAESSQPPGPAILDRDSWACWPRIKRQRVTWILSMGIGFVSVVSDAKACDFVERLNLFCSRECFNRKPKLNEIARPDNEPGGSSNNCPHTSQLNVPRHHQSRLSVPGRHA